MTFLMLAVLTFLVVLVFKKYKSVASVIITILLAFMITTAVLVAGLYSLDGNQFFNFFNSTIGRDELYHLMAAWYGADIFCSVLIVRNHIAYRKVNSPQHK
ncbi:MAG: hypothetical protein KA369_02010 [Spirochaetes bacterium]|nr:hypothetical protein [Spirochaetota bacterium]